MCREDQAKPIRHLVDRTVEAAREYGEAQANRRLSSELGNSTGADNRSVGRAYARNRALHEALLIVLAANDPTEEVPF